MNPRIQIIAIVGSALVLLLVFQLIRRRKLREEYALFWFVAGVALIGLSFWRSVLDDMARIVGVAYPPSVLLLAVIVVGFLLAMHYSISLSQLKEQSKKMAQEIALLRERLERNDAGVRG